MSGGRRRALAAVAAVVSGVTAVPPRVAEDAPRASWGGGRAETPGHGQPMQEQGGAQPLAELLEVPSWDTFYTDFVRKNRPVVFRGAARSQRGFEKWTDEYLRKTWGSRKIHVELNKSESRGGQTLEMPFRKFLEEMYSPQRSGELYAIVDFESDDRAKADFHLPEPIRCLEVLPQSMTLWISSGGTTSVLHHDDAENVLVMLAGRKTVMLVHQDHAQDTYARIAEHPGSSPVHQDAVDLEAFPRFANVSWISGEIGSGDMLYIPHTYWHQVNSYGRNLAVNLWWQHRDDWRWWDPYNRREYSAVDFGAPGRLPFDELKARAPASLPCTPLPSDVDLSQCEFMDEDRFKKRAKQKRAEARRRGEL